MAARRAASPLLRTVCRRHHASSRGTGALEFGDRGSDALGRRKVVALERAERHRHVRAGDARGRRVEVLKSLGGDRAGDVRAPATGVRILFDDHDAPGALDAAEHGGAIPRTRRAEVDDLARDVRKEICRRARDADHLAERDDGHVCTGTNDARRSERPESGVTCLELFLGVVEVARLEEDHRILVSDRTPQEAVGSRGS